MQKDGIERARKDNTAISLITPTGGYKVEGQVQGQSITLLVDTGAAVTLIRKDVWDRIFKDHAGLRPWAEQQLVSVDGSPLQVYGCASVELQLGGIPYPTDVVVVSPLTTEAILGLDFQKKYGATIDVGRCMMQMGTQATIRMCQSPPSCADGVRVVSLMDSLTIAPCSECIVMASYEGLPGGGLCIVEPKRGKRTPFLVARALVEPKNGSVPVRLLSQRKHVRTSVQHTVRSVMFSA